MDSQEQSRSKKLTALGLLVTLGIVFGDIGTSPLYVMQTIKRVNPQWDADYIIGAVSCVIWTLTLLTTVKYVIIALRADNKGEGGILALYSLLKKGSRKWLYVIAAIGAAALIADGVITPAITVTSAIEGLKEVYPDTPVLGIVIVIISVIFIIQKAGTDGIGKWFGPVMLIWFTALGVFGALRIPEATEIFRAFNPWYAVKLLIRSPEWFMVLGAVFLCTTGAEALYSDLGHCGRLNISVAWGYVKVMLVVNYLGQGAWMIAHRGHIPLSLNPFYGILPEPLVVPMVILAALAAIIASQALISGSFTIFSEAMGLKFFPGIKIKYPSEHRGQLYIPRVNWALYFGCLLTLLIFRSSAGLEAAYGLAITVTMLMTTLLLAFYLRRIGTPRWVISLFLLIFGAIEGMFFIANVFKFAHGGWFTMLVAGVVCIVMLLWRNSVNIRNRYIESKKIGDFFGVISDIKEDKEIPKYASNLVYLSGQSDPQLVESKLLYSIINKSPKRADHYWIVNINITDAPYTLDYKVTELIDHTLYHVQINLGFRMQPRITLYLRQIVEDLVAAGRLDLTSTYPSLQKHGIPGDFRFIMIHRIYSPDSNLGGLDDLAMKLHGYLRKLGTSDEVILGLDTSLVQTETVPLVISQGKQRRITPDK